MALLSPYNLAVKINTDLFGIRGTSGADTLVGTTAGENFYAYADNDRVYGDASGDFSGIGGNDQINGGAGNDTLFGDASRLTGSAVGGNDAIFADRAEASGVAGCTDVLYGDAYEINGTARGGNDYLYDYYLNAKTELYGDAKQMSNGVTGPARSIGGNDRIYAQAEIAHVCGDAESMVGNNSAGSKMWGGNDYIEFNSHYGEAFGDAAQLQGEVHCGNDTIVGYCQYTRWGTYGFTFYGDGGLAAGPGIYGGDDTLRGYWGNDKLVGDFARNGNTTYCGDDTLAGGSGNDTLWGDNETNTSTVYGGRDTFVFSVNSGQDTIMDFDQGSGGFDLGEGDLIDLTALHLTGIGNTVALGAGVLTSNGYGDAVLMLPNTSGYADSQNQVTFRGVSLDQLSLSDFLL